MLKRLEVKHFKSLDDFAIDFEPLTVLIGQNGSGKTTVLQVLDLLGAFLKGDVNHYLERLGWEYSSSLSSKTSKVTGFEFRLIFEAQGEEFEWYVHFLPWVNGLKIIEEHLNSRGSRFSFRSSQEPHSWYLEDREGKIIPLPEITIEFRQSILRAFKIKGAPAEIERAAGALDKIFMLSIDSVAVLRRPGKANQPVEKIGREGQDLASYLYALQEQDQTKAFSDLLAKFIPQVRKFRANAVNGEVVLSLEEQFPRGLDPEGYFEIHPTHLSEGTLRILVLLSALFGAEKGSVLLLDEIENAVDPNHLGILVQVIQEYIAEKSLQIILATHSPVILNYINEKGIRYFSRAANGNVLLQNPFERREISEMLAYMNPGEVWLNLSEEELKGGK